MMDEIQLDCPNCGAHLGRLIQYKGKIYLDTGSWLVSHGRRSCHACGRMFHFKPPRASWEELLDSHAEADL